MMKDIVSTLADIIVIGWFLAVVSLMVEQKYYAWKNKKWMDRGTK